MLEKIPGTHQQSRAAAPFCNSATKNRAFFLQVTSPHITTSLDIEVSYHEKSASTLKIFGPNSSCFMRVAIVQDSFDNSSLLQIGNSHVP